MNKISRELSTIPNLTHVSTTRRNKHISIDYSNVDLNGAMNRLEKALTNVTVKKGLFGKLYLQSTDKKDWCYLSAITEMLTNIFYTYTVSRDMFNMNLEFDKKRAAHIFGRIKSDSEGAQFVPDQKRLSALIEGFNSINKGI